MCSTLFLSTCKVPSIQPPIPPIGGYVVNKRSFDEFQDGHTDLVNSIETIIEDICCDKPLTQSQRNAYIKSVDDIEVEAATFYAKLKAYAIARPSVIGPLLDASLLDAPLLDAPLLDASLLANAPLLDAPLLANASLDNAEIKAYVQAIVQAECKDP